MPAVLQSLQMPNKGFGVRTARKENNFSKLRRRYAQISRGNRTGFASFIPAARSNQRRRRPNRRRNGGGQAVPGARKSESQSKVGNARRFRKQVSPIEGSPRRLPD